MEILLVIIHISLTARRSVQTYVPCRSIWDHSYRRIMLLSIKALVGIHSAIHLHTSKYTTFITLKLNKVNDTKSYSICSREFAAFKDRQQEAKPGFAVC